MPAAAEVAVGGGVSTAAPAGADSGVAVGMAVGMMEALQRTATIITQSEGRTPGTYCELCRRALRPSSLPLVAARCATSPCVCLLITTGGDTKMRQVTARCDCTAATMCRDVRGGLLTLPCMKMTPVMPGVSDTDRAWSVMMTRKGPETLRSCGLVTSGQAP